MRHRGHGHGWNWASRTCLGFALAVVACEKEQRDPIVSADRGGSDSRGGSSGTAARGGSGGTGRGGGSGTDSGEAGSPAGGEGAIGTGGGGGSSGEGTEDPTGSLRDCSAQKPCETGDCIEVWPGGYRTCQTTPEEATSCTGNPEDECCDTSDCATGRCFSSDSYPWFGPGRPAEFNLCGTDSCENDADCTNDQLCLPSGVLGRPVRMCISALCLIDEDCTEYEHGVCLPVEDECGGGIGVFACAYAGPGACRKNSDCSADTAPFTPGERYCDNGSCVTVLSGTVCG